MKSKYLLALLLGLAPVYAANIELETNREVADDGSVRIFQWTIPEAELHASPRWDGKSAIPFDIGQLSSKAIKHVEDSVSEPKVIHLRSISINRGPLGPDIWYIRFHFDGNLDAVPKTLIMLPSGFILKPIDITKK